MFKMSDWNDIVVVYNENLKSAGGEVVIYARVALNENDELKKQADELIKNAEAVGDSLYAVFYESESGLDENRPEFIKMMEYIKKKKVRRLYIKDISRISRNYIMIDKVMNEIMSMGVEIVIK